VCYLILLKGQQKTTETCLTIDQLLELIDPRLYSGMATPVEKLLHNVGEKTSWRRPPMTEIVAEVEPGLVKQESNDSSEEGHDTLNS